MNAALKKVAQRFGVSPDTVIIVGVAAAVGVLAAAAVALASPVKSKDESDPAAVTPTAPASPSGAADGLAAAGSAPAGGASSDPAPMPGMSKEKLLRVLRRTREETEAISVRLVEEMQQLSQSGLDMAEMQVQYQDSMSRLLRESEDRIGAEFGFTKEELMEANIAYKDDPEVKEVVADLKRIIFGEGGEGDELQIGEVPEDMTPDVFLEIYQKQIEFIYESFVQMAELARTHAPPGEQRLAALELAMQQNFERIVEQSMQISGMDMPTFQACVQRFQSTDPRFMQEATNNAQRLAELRQKLLEEE